MLMVTMVLFNNFRCYMSSCKKDTKHIMKMLNFRYSYEVVLLLECCRNRPFYSCVLSYLAMNASEAGGDLALIQTFKLFSCKCKLVSMRTT